MAPSVTTFSDYFSQSARLYAKYRPHYPPELFEWLAGEAPGHDRAWDCGTGSGQAAGALAAYFNAVVATDPSVAQLANAAQVDGVFYLAATAEQSPLQSRSAQLVSVAQALHWFDLPRFYEEANRVLVPGGLLAVWSYGLINIDTLAPAIGRFYSETLGPWWPKERSTVESGYATLPFPYAELRAPAFRMEASWTLDQLEGYLNSWSAVTRCTAATGTSPVPDFVREIEGVWGTASEVRTVTWPLQVRAGRTAR